METIEQVLRRWYCERVMQAVRNGKPIPDEKLFNATLKNRREAESYLQEIRAHEQLTAFDVLE